MSYLASNNVFRRLAEHRVTFVHEIEKQLEEFFDHHLEAVVTVYRMSYSASGGHKLMREVKSIDHCDQHRLSRERSEGPLQKNEIAAQSWMSVGHIKCVILLYHDQPVPSP